MMPKSTAEQFAAKYAKEIVVAKAASMNVAIDSIDGKNVADFYTEIYKGIAKALASPAFLDSEIEN